MMLTRFTKETPSGKIALTTAVGTTPELPMASFAGGTIYIPSGSSITSLSFYGAPWKTGDWPGGANQVPGASAPAPTFYQLYNSSNAAVTQSVTAGKCYALPADIFGFAALKIVADVAGSVEVTLKG